MRYFTDQAIRTSMEEEGRLYVKLGSYAPDDKLSRNDIGQLMFILRQYRGELERILRDREKALRERERAERQSEQTGRGRPENNT